MKKIIFKNVTFSYADTVVLNELNLEIESGRFISLVGSNGAGKSTIAKMLIGLIIPKKGEIYVDGVLLNEKSVYDIRNKIGIVFQNPDNQFIGATVEEDIAFGLENRRVPTNEMRPIIDRVIHEVGMEEYAKTEPTKLSGGQKQRVAIAGVLALNPDIIIFDEATSMLDPKGRKDFERLINDLRKNKPDLTIISITHNIDEILRSDEAIVLSEGKIYKRGTPKEIFTDNKLIEDFGFEQPFIYKLINDLTSKGYDTSKCETLEDVRKLLCR